MFVMALQFLLLLAMLATDVSAGSATFYYSDGPWKGKVVDAETKQPIEGVVVLAVWEKFYRTPAGRNAYFYDATEVLTNKDGEFVIPKFNALNFNPLAGIEGPSIKIYKPGYALFPGFGAHYYKRYFPQYREIDDIMLVNSLKRGFLIEIPRLKSKEERIESLNLVESFPINYAPEEKYPNMSRSIKEENRNLGLTK